MALSTTAVTISSYPASPVAEVCPVQPKKVRWREIFKQVGVGLVFTGLFLLPGGVFFMLLFHQARKLHARRNVA